MVIQYQFCMKSMKQHAVVENNHYVSRLVDRWYAAPMLRQMICCAYAAPGDKLDDAASLAMNYL